MLPSEFVMASGVIKDYSVSCSFHISEIFSI